MSFWDLGDLYDGPQDPRMEADRQWCLKEADRFAPIHTARVALLSAKALHTALASLETLEEKCDRIVFFAYLSFVTQTQDPGVGRLYQGAREFETSVQCGKLEDLFSTTFRQISMNRFEESGSPGAARGRGAVSGAVPGPLLRIPSGLSAWTFQNPPFYENGLSMIEKMFKEAQGRSATRP